MRIRWHDLVVGIVLSVALVGMAGCGSKADEPKPAEEAAPAAEESQPEETAPATDGAQPEEAATGEQGAEEGDARTEYSGFDDAREESIGRFSVMIPGYFTKADAKNVTAQFNGQNNDVSIQFQTVEDTQGHGGVELLEALVNSLGEGESVTSYEITSKPTRVEGVNLESYRASAMGTTSGVEMELESAIVLDEDGKSALVVLFGQLPSSKYSYKQDFEKIVASVTVKGLEAEEAPAEEADSADTGDIRPEFKEAMDSYEAFFDEYVEYMQLYQSDPTNLELLTGLSDMLSRESEMIEQFDAWENEDLNAAEMAYYLEVQSRIYQKLATVV